MGNVTGEEQLALNATAVTAIDSMHMLAFSTNDPNYIYLPATGIEWSCRLIQQNGDKGYGYALNVEPGYSPINTTKWEDNFMYQSPLMYSFIVCTAEPEDCGSRGFTAKVKSDALPEGIDVKLLLVAQNEEKTVHIFHTEFFLAVNVEAYDVLINDDAEPAIFDRWSEISEQEAWLYDPNYFPDPNYPPFTIDTLDPDFMEYHDPNRIKPLHYIPLEETDELRLQLVPDVACLELASREWLGSGRSFDFNGDGVVNFADLFGAH